MIIEVIDGVLGQRVASLGYRRRRAGGRVNPAALGGTLKLIADFGDEQLKVA